MSEQTSSFIRWGIIKLWAVAYAVFVVLYVANLLLRTEPMTPDQFLTLFGNVDGKPLTEYAFPADNNPAAIYALEQKILASRNKDTDATNRVLGSELRFEEFTRDIHGKLSRRTEAYAKNIRLTNRLATELALTILADKTRAEKNVIIKEVTLVKENLFTNFNWEEGLLLLNSAGLFVLLYGLLATPLSGFFAKSAETQANQYQQALHAEEEAKTLSKRRAELDAALLAEKQKMIENEATEMARVRQSILDQAHSDAQGLVDGIRARIEMDVQVAALRLRQQVVSEAVELAYQRLLNSTDKAGHNRAVEQVIHDISVTDLR